MKKYLPIYLYGAIIIVEGIFLLLSEYNSFNTINQKIGVPLIVGAILAYIAAFSRQRKQVQFAYHELHALAMLVYGVALLVFCNSFEKLTSYTAFLLIFYAFSEIIFCNWLFNLGQKILYKTIIVRLILGLAIGIGTVVAMNFSIVTLQGFGVLFIMVGINLMLYIPVMKGTDISTAPIVTKET